MENTATYGTEVATRIDTVALSNIVQQAPAILAENTNSHDKAIEAGKRMLASAEQNGMSDDLDKLMSSFLDKLRLTHKTINERRKPFTTIVQACVKEFTTLEADIDPAGKANIFFQVQTRRNDYAAQKIAEQQKKEREAKEKLEREKELISIKSFGENSLRQAVARYTTEFKGGMLRTFEGITLGNIENAATLFAGIEQIDFRHLAIDNTPRWIYVSDEDAKAMISQVRNSLVTELKECYKNEVVALRRELIDKLPSKKAELEAMAKAGEAEKARLQHEAGNRRKAEEQRMKDEAEAKAKQAAEDARIKEESEKIDATVTTQAELFTEAPKVKEGCEIVIKNVAAWQLVFMFWFEREGKTLSAEKIEKKTMLQMKSYCEKIAVTTGEEISSGLIEYKITYKAK